MFSVCRLCCSLSPALLLEVTGGVVLLLFETAAVVGEIQFTVHENQNVVCSQCSACPQHFGSLSRVRTSELSMRSTCQPRRTQPWKLRIRLVLEGRVSGRNIRARPPRGTWYLPHHTVYRPGGRWIQMSGPSITESRPAAGRRGDVSAGDVASLGSERLQVPLERPET
ncbi:hypothetical protein T01_4920, partial [Trichinella spiralis]